MKHLDHFFEFCAERQRLTDTTGDTADPVFQGVGFGYIIREEDGLTSWFDKQIRSELQDPDDVLLACVVFRWFNTIQAGSLLRPWLLRNRPWNEKQILQEIESTGKPLVHGMIVPQGVRREAAVLSLVRPFVRSHLGRECEDNTFSMRHMHGVLSTFDHLSPALAYEIVSDLRHTAVLCGAEDINHWAHVSPYITRGMGYVVSDDPLEFIFGHDRTNHGMLSLMRGILEDAWELNLPWEMREVESALYEFHRYRTAQQLGPYK